MKIIETDIAIVGTGAAGLFCALKVSSEMKVTLITKTQIAESNSSMAQGGIACCLDSKDSFQKHFDDSLIASSFTSDGKALLKLISQSKEVLDDLISYGVLFDKNDQSFLLGREGGHSENRILHCADATGKSVTEKLIEAAKKKPHIHWKENCMATKLLMYNNHCVGLLAFDNTTGEYVELHCKAVVLATGGGGEVFIKNTNSKNATGDGYAIAYLAGAELKDMEFVQFHPTSFQLRNGKQFLITEALRGAGAKLVLPNGEWFMKKYHTSGSLAPRDVVSRGIFSEMQKHKLDHVFLDARMIQKEKLMSQFPNIYAVCLSEGIDMTTDLIPVSPAAHFICGGITTDLNGVTSIKNLFAIGEVACTGVHGANRLASNSLLECLVFAKQTAKAIHFNSVDEKFDGAFQMEEENQHGNKPQQIQQISKCRLSIQQLMWEHAGIVRSSAKMEEGKQKLFFIGVQIEKLMTESSTSIALFELRNIFLTALLILNAAMKNKLSIGTHFLHHNIESIDQASGFTSKHQLEKA